MAYLAKITTVGIPDAAGVVQVDWEFCDDDTVLIGGLSVSCDPVVVRDNIRARASELAAAFAAVANLRAGETVEL